MSSEFGTFKHSGNSGDIISALPAMCEYYRQSQRKIILYLNLGVKAWYYDGAEHPVKDSDGDQVMVNEYMFNMIRPLLLSQPCIEDVRVYNGEDIEVDLDRIRETNVGMPGFDLRRWYFYVFPNLACDLTKPYIYSETTAKDFATDKIIVNRTQRYQNQNINYSFLKDYYCVFAGTEGERELFNKQFGLDIPKLQVGDFLELAQAMEQCTLFLGNQSMCAAISQGLKIPRVIEICPFVPNVIVTEKNAYDFLSQTAVEYYVKTLSLKQAA